MSMRDLHQRAMALSDEAELAKQNGDLKEAVRFFTDAYQLEEKAAIFVETAYDIEPTRSVLYRSAASMAIDAGQLDDARRLIAKGLSGFPPPNIETELYELLDSVTFTRHLEVRNIELQPDQLQLAIDGRDVGRGIAVVGEVLGRIRDFERLIWRTVERLKNAEFRLQGSPGKEVTGVYSVWMSVPRPGSFAVTLTVGQQMQLPFEGAEGVITSSDVIKEVLQGIELVSTANEDGLKQLIPDDTYRENFRALVKHIEPDGDKITLVGFTAQQEGEPKRIAMRKVISDASIRAAARVQPQPQKADERVREYTGRLMFADATRAKGVIKLSTEDDQTYRIIVSAGLTDIVRPYFEEIVTVIGVRKGRNIELLDIRSA